jgi:hypothetical protein
MTQPKEKGYESALKKAYQALKKLEPYKTGFMAGCDFRPGEEGDQFDVRFLDEDFVVTFPDFSVQNASGQEPDTATRLIILHYLIHADGTPPADHWISFRELPDGLVYDPAFQKRSGLRLAHEYGMDPRAFSAAAEAVGGERLAFGDVSYMFRLLPRIRMAVILYVGDEEFGPRVNVLFDSAASHYLPIEDLAVLGGMLATRLIKAGNV